MINRRKHLRIPMVMTVHITRKGAQTAAEAFVRDICTHGMGVHTNEVYKKGDVLLIDIALLNDKKEEIKGSIRGEVAWVEPLQEGGKYAVGIRFEHLDTEKPKLYEQIRRLEQSNNNS